MIAISNKTKQYLLAALKVLILGVTFIYIYSKVTSNPSLSISEFGELIWQKDTSELVYLILFIALTTTNWLFEIKKWQTVASFVVPISFRTAAKQSLASLTVSLATPNRIADYGAKALFYEAAKRKQVMVLNFFSNGMQLLVTVFFGIIGLAIISSHYHLSLSVENLSILIGCLIVLIGLGIFFKKTELILKGLSIEKVLSFIKKLNARVKFKVCVYAFCRYLVFSYLFFLLLLFFESDIAFLIAYPLIFSMYLLVSLIPSIFIFDVVIRGGVAVWLFSLAGIPEFPVLLTVLAMWLLNFVIPAIVGSFYVITYKSVKA